MSSSQQAGTSLAYDKRMLSGEIGLEQTIFVQEELSRRLFVIRVVARERVSVFKVIRSTHPLYPVGTVIPVRALGAPNGAFPDVTFEQFRLRGRLRRFFKDALGPMGAPQPNQ